MSNDLVTMDNIASGLKAYRATRPAAPASSGFLKMNRAGVWTYGRDHIEVADDSEWLVDIRSFGKGWIVWADGRPQAQVLAPLSTVTPEVPAEFAGAAETLVGFALAGVAGEDDGVSVKWTGNASGAIDGFNALVDAVGDYIDANGPAFPIVTLGASHYIHKQYGKIYKPVFEIVEWMTVEEAMSGQRSKAEPVPEGAEAETDDDDGDDDAPVSISAARKRRRR